MVCIGWSGELKSRAKLRFPDKKDFRPININRRMISMIAESLRPWDLMILKVPNPDFGPETFAQVK